VIFFLGIKDDILVLSPIKKFIGQVLAAFIIIYKGGIQIKSMGGFLGIHELPEMFSLLLTYLTVIVIINSFNLIDGVDGLAGTLGLMATVILGSYFLYVNHIPFAILAFSLAGALVAFLIFNFQPAKIFMGDCGSLLLGLTNAILAVKFIEVADIQAGSLPIQSAVAVGISVLIIPLLDTVRVFSIRIFKGRSPFTPDRNHIHHLLLDRGLGHKHVSLFCFLLNIVFITLTYFGRNLGPTYLLCVMCGICFTFLAVLLYAKKPARSVIVSSKPLLPNTKQAVEPTTKVVAIHTEPLGTLAE